MNPLQTDIAEIVIRLVTTNDFKRMVRSSAIRYGLLNYIAKFSLANDNYLITDAAMQRLHKLDLVTKNGLRRGSKSQKRGFTYEHPVPSNIIADYIISVAPDIELIKKALTYSDCVTVMTADENAVLNGTLVATMPDDWQILKDNPFARYIETGLIRNTDDLKRIPVYGAIAR